MKSPFHSFNLSFAEHKAANLRFKRASNETVSTVSHRADMQHFAARHVFPTHHFTSSPMDTFNLINSLYTHF